MLALDHIVLAGKDIEEASTKYGSKFAIKAIKGGEHKNWGTYNYLAYFSNDSYIEWLGVQDAKVAANSENPLIQHLIHQLEHDQIGAYQLALRTDNMNQYLEHFRAKKIPYKGPFYGERKRPDGSLLKWKMLFPQYDYSKEMLPFLIEWEEPYKMTGPIVKSLANPQTITDIYYGGVDKDTFTYFYQLKPRRLLKNQLNLQNTKIHFTNDQKLTFNVV